jgi:hypothetical protein
MRKNFITIGPRTSDLIRVFQVPLSWPHNSALGLPTQAATAVAVILWVT